MYFGTGIIRLDWLKMKKPGLRCGEAGGGGGLEEMTNRTRREKSCLPYLPRGLIATSHAARENFIRIMPGVAQAIEEVLRSGHVPRAHGRLFAI
jgi:hypothetical protein